MRLIDADKILLGRTENIYGKLIPLVTKNDIDNTPTVNAIPIPDGATNGDMIKALFPQMKINEAWKATRDGQILSDDKKHVELSIASTSEWWNALYKAESENKQCI